MDVVAKFKVIEIAQIKSYHQQHPIYHRVKMMGVQSLPFGDATPNANLDMVIANDEAAKAFEVDKEYYVTFSADPPGA